VPEFICCGGLRVDYIIAADGQVRIHEMGGNGLYAAAGARVWGADVGLLARIGENYPAGWLDELARQGLDVRGIRVLAGKQDMRTFYVYTDPRTRTDTEPAIHFARIGVPLPGDLSDYINSTPGQDDPDDYEPLAIQSGDWCSAYDKARALHLSPISIRTHAHLPSQARRSGITQITVDPGERYMVPRLRAHVQALLEQVDVFLPSEQEVRSLLGAVDLWQAAEDFARCGPRVLVIKVGDQGVLVYERDPHRRTHVPAYPARVVDTTGAGDAFCGGFMVGLAATGDPVRAAQWGSVSASFAIEDYGALHVLRADRKEAEARLSFLEQVRTRS
jgi:sugar/nucleoside kinase (ribokinase family)